MKTKNVHTYTFGCKVNHFDTTRLEAYLRQDQDVVIDHRKVNKPDAIVVNTCTVTENADKEAQALIRRLGRKHPGTDIVITGCYAQNNQAMLKEKPNVKDVLRFEDYSRINDVLGLKSVSAQTLPVVKTPRFRANVKIQDGCKAYCSYCVIPFVREKSTSTSMSYVLKQVDAFVASGHPEIILTGTHIAGYGRDLRPRKRLSDIIRAIHNAHPALPIRISSLEPVGVTPDFVKAVQNISTIQPHFHIPLQSGSDAILKNMNRKYKSQHYRDRIEKLIQAKPGANIGTDVIVGYPGETKDDFEQTQKLLEELPISYAHVFPFSARPATKAARMKETVTPMEKKRRVRALIQVMREKKQAYYDQHLQKTKNVFVENKRVQNDMLKGITPESIPVLFQGHDRLKHTCVGVTLTHMKTDATGEPVVYGKVI